MLFSINFRVGLGGNLFMNNKNIRYNIDDHHHGLFIKEARLRKEYRISDLAEGVCSPSYLSKIEAGDTTPSLDIFEHLAERLDIRFPAEQQGSLTHTFRQIIYNSQLHEIDNYLLTASLHHYELQLGRFFQAVLLKQSEKALALRNLIDQFSHHFNDEEQQFYALFSGICSFMHYEWEKGKKHFKKSLDLMFRLNIDDPYLYFQLAQYYFHTQNVSLGFAFLERAIAEFKILYAKDWVFDCGIIKCREYLRNNEVENAENELLALQSINMTNQESVVWSDIYSLQGMIFDKKCQFNQAETYFNKSVQMRGGVVKEDCLVEAIKFYYSHQNTSKMMKMFEQLDIKTLSKRNKILVDFYYLKITNIELEEFEFFLKKEALPYAIKTLNARDVTLYTKELTKICRDNLRHKKVAEAYYKWEQFRENLESNGVIR